ncbi:haloacid dehalogenase-like hydrolase [Maioricimonas rarisocia]|uniref:phosphoserine phosphatase n=1 Tax=Maioricimonas rarisocia TaxID=2528026 RepID=A0A517Z5F3_9PLAN|nr:HAD family hydrolase [Maioricimonas rarisocia]QDU37687.1 haloacid dehalogenase-like hydrolase [Maioricimonas rarisocia]
MRRLAFLLATLAVTLPPAGGLSAQSADPLPSWNEGPTKQQIVSFVEAVTDADSPDFVPEAERIAVFDNDGTLWAEQPMYIQLAFAIDRLHTLAKEKPELKEKEPYRSILNGDLKSLAAGGEHAILEVLMATHADTTTDQFSAIVADWLETARHPKTDRPYTGMVYQPMLELLAYLRASGFKTFIVSGGGVAFMRVFSEKAYGIPPEQVIGSTIVTKFEMRASGPVLVRLPKIDFIDDKEGKPVGINRNIGRRPIAAFGNSDGDLQMLQWTTAGPGRRLGAIVHHTDAEREWAYDRDSHIGRLDKALDEGRNDGWTIIDMKQDWAQVFPPRN